MHGRALQAFPSAATVEMSTLFPADDYEQFEFSALHRGVLSLPGLPFQAALEMIKRSQIDAVDAAGMTALMWAAGRGDLNMVSRLLDCGADPNKQDLGYSTALHWAVAGEQPECIEEILCAKGSLEIMDLNGRTPLLCTGRLQSALLATKVLLKHGANLDVHDNKGQTVLHIAAWEVLDIKRFHLLVRCGANINALGDRGFSVLYSAICAHNHKLLRTLLEYEDLQLCQIEESKFFLEAAASFGDAITLHILIAAIDNFDIGHVDKQEMVDKALDIADWRLAMNEHGSVFRSQCTDWM